MTTFRIVLLAMTLITIALIVIAAMMEYNFSKTGEFALRNPFRRKMFPANAIHRFQRVVTGLITTLLRPLPES